MTTELEQEDDAGRLQKLETHALKTEGRVDSIEKTQVIHTAKLDSHSTKLDQIYTAVTIQQNAPRFDAHKMISTIRDLFAVGATVGVLSVWLIGTLSAATERATALEIKNAAVVSEMQIKHTAELAGMKYDILKSQFDRMSSAITWRPSIEGVK